MPFVIAPLLEVGIAAILGAEVASTAIIGGLTVGGLVSGALLTGAVVGAELMLRPHRQPSYSPYQPQMPVATNVSAQSIGPRFHAAGQVRVGGTYIFRESDGGATLGYGIVLNCGPIDSVVAYFVDDELQTIGTDGTLCWPVAGMKYAGTYVKVWSYGQWVPVFTGYAPSGHWELRNASDAGAYSALLSASFPALWPSTRLCKGLTVLYSKWNAQNLTNLLGVYPNRFPQHSTVIRGEPVYDPRDGAQNFADPSTWKFSRSGVPDPGRNPALIWAHYWTHSDGGRLEYSDVDWSAIAQAANDCDRLVPAFGSVTEPFARCDMQWHAGETPTEVEARILATCDGVPYETNGKQSLWIAQAVTPSITLTAADISSASWDELSGAMSETNYIQSSYAEPRVNYSFMATAPVTDNDSIAAVGERPQTLELRGVTSFSQAYRLAHRVLRRQNPPLRVTVTGGPRLARALNEFMVTINAPEFGISGTFRPVKLFDVDFDNWRFSVQFAAIASDAFDDVVPPSDPVSPDLGGAASVVIPNGIPAPLDIPHAITWSGGTPIPYIIATAWAYQTPVGTAPGIGTPIGTPIDTTIAYHVRWRRVDGSHAPLEDWTIWPPNFIGDAWHFESPQALPSTIYELQAWFVSELNGLPGPLSASVFVSVPAGP